MGLADEGHHLSLNFAFRGGRVVGTTPFFFGANPATVDEGPQKGTRVLAAEEEMGRALLHTFTGALRGRIINVSAPADIVTGASQRVRLGAPAGVSMRELSAAQGKMLTDLIELYARRLQRSWPTRSCRNSERREWRKSSSPGLAAVNAASRTTIASRVRDVCNRVRTRGAMPITFILCGATSITILA